MIISLIFQDMFESSELQTNYPPYDIIRTVIQNTIFVALAGYSKNDIIVEVKDNTLSIKSVKKDVDDKIEVLHKGILGDILKDILLYLMMLKNGAELKNGLLVVSLERVIPEHKKPRTITIK